MDLFNFQTGHQDCTAQVSDCFERMVTWAAPIFKSRKWMGIGTDFPMIFLMENQAS